MNYTQAQTGNDILNYLCRFINNKPVPLKKIARDLKLDIHDVDAVIHTMMDVHSDWYSMHKKMFSGQAVMLQGTVLKDIHKFLVLGGYTEMVDHTVAVPAKKKETKTEEKTAGTRNTVIIKPRLGLNHS